MVFGKYGNARSLAPPFLFGIACARAGIPTMFIAPPAGGKSVTIFAIEKYLKEHDEKVRRINRIGLRGLQKLSKWLNDVQTAVLLNEEFSSIGSSAYMTEKMGELIGNIAYSKSYHDDGLDIHIEMVKLGFLSGVQPLWVSNIMVHRVFATHIREKFLRYYMLPYDVTPDVDDYEVISTLTEKTNEHEPYLVKRIPNEFVCALAKQVGITRAKRYAPQIAHELSKLIPKDTLGKALRFYAENLAFENDMVIREIDEKGYIVRTRWREYTALYWCLRRGKLTAGDFMLYLGVTSGKSVYNVINAGLEVGWITRVYNNSRPYYMATEGWRKRRAW